MSRGGARVRSGPPVDPNSGRSETRGLTFTTLAAEGYAGEPPVWPLVSATVREQAVWVEAWRTPQAAAWAEQSWRWPIVAEYCRLKATCEQDANASLIAQLHRYRDQLGLTPAGLRDNGWVISANEVARKAAERREDVDQARPARRLRVAEGDGAP